MTLTLRWKWRKTSTCLNWHTWRCRKKYPGFLRLKNARKFTDAQENLEGASFAHTFWSGFVDNDVWCPKKTHSRNKNTRESEHFPVRHSSPLAEWGGFPWFFRPGLSFYNISVCSAPTGPLWASVFDMQALPAQALLATLGANKKRLEALNFWTQHWSKGIAEIFWISLISWFLQKKKKTSGFHRGDLLPKIPKPPPPSASS